MKSLGDIMYDSINHILCKLIHANKYITSVTELSIEEIDKLIEYYGIKGVILDIDETLRFDMGDIPIENIEWLDMLKTKLKVIVLSNGMDKNIRSLLEEKGIVYLSMALKPLKRNFIKACNILELNPNEVVVIGDDIISDIYGGNRCNMTTIKVNSDKVLKKK